MRVALLSANAHAKNAIGNQVAEKAAFFHERGAEVRLFLQNADRLHPELRAFAEPVNHVGTHGHVWDYLSQADLVIACDRKVMRGQPSSWLSRGVVILAALLMFAAAAGMFVF